MNIVMVSSEAAPYSKTGGLADVAAALPKELTKLGHNVKTFSPFYKCVSRRVTDISNTGIKVLLTWEAKLTLARFYKKMTSILSKTTTFTFMMIYMATMIKSMKTIP